VITEVERQPVNIPLNLAGLFSCPENRLNRVLGQFPQELEWMTVFAETIEEEANVVDLKAKRVLCRSSGHCSLPAPFGGLCDDLGASGSLRAARRRQVATLPATNFERFMEFGRIMTL
jgi:hypothetical protein